MSMNGSVDWACQCADLLLDGCFHASCLWMGPLVDGLSTDGTVTERSLNAGLCQWMWTCEWKNLSIAGAIHLWVCL